MSSEISDIFRTEITVRGQPGPDYIQGLRRWRTETPAELAGRAAALTSTGQHLLHFEALRATLHRCGQLIVERTIRRVEELPTADDCWHMIRENTEYRYDEQQKKWYTVKVSDYALAGNLLPPFPGQYHHAHSLFKPEIGRRVARMHGTTKARWEREARAF